jgi:peptidoglycan/LPS O-acetylase OafA/YrhL
MSIPTNSRQFRPDIEALRAIAIIAVVIAHSKLTLSGGFIGVDIFFVISGFLITSHIFKEITNTGKLSLKSFYSRRILRILPASTFVILATLLASYIWLSPLQFVNYTWDALFSSFSGINYRLAENGTNYFQSTSLPTPFQHFWSLAVEEQFYFIWPLITVLLAKFFVKKNENASTEMEEASTDQSKSTTYNVDAYRIVVSGFLVIVIAISLYFSNRITYESQPWAYFGLHTRAWQLAVGALVAFNLSWLSKISIEIARALGWLGFVGLITGFALITEATVYPGLWPLIPTISTALIIIGGINKPKHSFESVFGDPIITFFGKISYSWYLIHWPLFVIYLFYAGRDSVKDKIFIILVSLVLAIVSYFVVENPIRYSKVFKSSLKNTYLLGISCILLISMISGLLIYSKDSTNQSLSNDLNEQASDSLFVKKIQEGLNQKTITETVALNLLQSQGDMSLNKCIAKETDELPILNQECILGNVNSLKSIVLLGDSHADQWIENINSIAKKNDYKLYSFTKPGCPMSDIKIINPLLKREYLECYKWRIEALKQIETLNPNLLIYTSTQYENSSLEIYSKFVLKLQQISNKLIILNDTPVPTLNIPECLSKNKTDMQKCSFKYVQNLGIQNQKASEIKYLKDQNVQFINTVKWFCIKTNCPPIIDNIIVYRDKSHITNSFSNYLTDLMNEEIFPKEIPFITKIESGLNIKKLPNGFISTINESVTKNDDTCISPISEASWKERVSCTVGDTTSNDVMVLLGDSHAEQWRFTFDKIAQKNGYKLVVFSKSGCPMSDISKFDEATLKRDYTECYSWRKEVLDKIKQLNPKIIISASLTYSNSTSEKYTEYLNNLKSISSKVVLVEDSPHPLENVPECLIRNSITIQKCNLNKTNSVFNPLQKEMERSIAKEKGVFTVDTLQYFCNQNSCPTIIDNNLVYFDNNHISNSYSKYLSDYISLQLLEILKK